LNRVFTAEDDPVKLNIKTVHEFRNSATHLVIPFIPADIMGLFQAGVLNYPRLLHLWFGINLSNRVPLGMMALVYDFDPTEYSLDHAKMARLLSTETVQWLKEFQQGIRNRASSLVVNNEQFYIPINFKLTITKNPKTSDIIVSSGGGRQALVMQIAKDPDRTHPYRQTEVVKLVNQTISSQIINQWDIQCIKRVYNIENNAEFFNKQKYGPKQYSQQFVDWLVGKVTKNSDFFLRTRREANISYQKKET